MHAVTICEYLGRRVRRTRKLGIAGLLITAACGKAPTSASENLAVERNALSAAEMDASTADVTTAAQPPAGRAVV